MHDRDSLEDCYFSYERPDRRPKSLGAHVCECVAFSEIWLLPNGLIAEYGGLIPAAVLRGRYWWTRSGLNRMYSCATTGSHDFIDSTEEIFAAIEEGFEVSVIRGPFNSREDAHYALDVAWEAPDFDD